jgi:hypothetical protein
VPEFDEPIPSPGILILVPPVTPGYEDVLYAIPVPVRGLRVADGVLDGGASDNLVAKGAVGDGRTLRC